MHKIDILFGICQLYLDKIDKSVGPVFLQFGNCDSFIQLTSFCMLYFGKNVY